MINHNGSRNIIPSDRSDSSFAGWSSSEQENIAKVSRGSIREFFVRLNYSASAYTPDLQLANAVRETTRQWIIKEDMEPHIITGILMAERSYAHTSLDTKIAIALYTAIAVGMDDPRIMESFRSKEFHRSLCTGPVAQESSMLVELKKVLDMMFERFSRFGANAILTSTLQFMNISLVEANQLIICKDVLPFVEYRRIQNGYAEAYTCFIWEKATFPDAGIYLQAIPCAMKYINYVNDILSFYKEEVAGETGNYIHDRACLTGKSSLETLREVIDESLAAMEQVRVILGDGDARKAWDSFVMGYVSFHMHNPRYHLTELL